MTAKGEDEAAANQTDGAPAPGGGKKLGPLQVLSSLLAAGLGVQSSKNRERDFTHGRAGTFIIGGLILTALFIGAVLTVVKLVVNSAG